MLLNMSRPPSIPSHSGPPPSYSPYPPHHASSSRPEIIAPSQHIRPRDSSGSHNNAQQLPSLRTLLEPELLDKKSSDPSLRAGGAPALYNHSGRYGSSSPTLKRRHEYDGYFHGHPEHNAIASQTPYHHRQPLSGTNATPSTSSSTPGSGFGVSRVDLQRRESFAHPSQHDLVGNGTYCRAIIDGEAVNPSWGITKAGKPRKRLAQACLTCREKKIKCEPGYPKCHQCSKSQRVCRG